MYIGTQYGCRDDTDIEVLSQLGVLNVDQTPNEPWTEWTTDLLTAQRDRFDKYGINLDMIHIPLGSGSAFENEAGAVFLGPSDERKKIFNVHFRNIKGHLGNFVEVFPDEGDIDMLKALRVYKEVGYEYMIMPDHVPGISGAESGSVGFAFTYGYIHALLQAVNDE